MTALAYSRPSLREAAAFTLPHFREWTRRLTLDTEEEWELEDFQAAFAADLFSGIPVCWLVIPEGNTKTTTVAGLALYHIEHKPTGYVPVAASTREQAEWIYRQAEGFVYRSELRSTFKCLEGYRRIRCDGMGSRIQVFAADDRGGDGVIPTLPILEELHRHRDLALYRTWLGKLRKRNAQLVALSTAGEVGGEFEQERELLRQSATSVERRGCFVRALREFEGKPLSVLHDYAVPEHGDVEDLGLVKAANPFSGITVESLREKREITSSLAHWTRFTCNRSTRAVSAAVTEAEWAAAADGWVPIPDGEPRWLGLDVAWKHDTTALVPLWVPTPQQRVLGRPTILTPPRDGNSLDPNLVEKALLAEHERGPLHTVVMDTTRAEQLAEWISQEFGATVVDRGQTNAFAAQDYERFMEALRSGWLKQPNDPGLTRHVLNAVVRDLPNGRYRFDRPRDSRTVRQAQQERRVIDALTAAAMVHSAAVAELQAEPPAVPLVAIGGTVIQ